MPDTDADQNSALAYLGAFKQLQSAYPSLDRLHSTMAGSVTSPSSPVGKRTLHTCTTVEMACL